ncbi:hypothetical protein ScPMuIL_001635 [Solemya velum]
MASVGSMCVRSASRLAVYTRSCSLKPLVSRCVRMSTTATESEKKQDSSPAKEAGTESEQSAVEKALLEQKTKLETEITELKDKYKRALAETENVRKRMQKQVDDAKIFGIQSFCKDLLDVSDILGKATTSVPKDQLTSANVHLTNLYEGLTMTEGQLLKVFTKHGLEKISPNEGDKFDPYVHEAMFQIPTKDKEGGTIAEITKGGYKLHERTLRPALVGVYKR